MIVFDKILLSILILLIVASIRYGIEHKDYVVGIGWIIPMLGLVVYYAMIVMEIRELTENLAFRDAIVRPSLTGFLLMVLVHILNGQVNKFLSNLSQKVSTWTHSHFKTLFP